MSLTSLIETSNELFSQLHTDEYSDEYRALAKLMEESGEVAGAIYKEFSDDKIAEEIGDVIISVNNLIEKMKCFRGFDYNIEQCVELSVAKIESRTNILINGKVIKKDDLRR